MDSGKNAVFTGGIHPTDGSDKALSKDKPITVWHPEKVYLSLAQTPSSICEAVVKKGDRLTRGQLVAEPKNFTAVRLHSSVSGTVENIEVQTNGGRETQVLVIKADSEQPSPKDTTYLNEVKDISGFEPEGIVKLMEDGGICGMGGAGFPTHVKFKSGKKIDYVLINAAECESYLTCDYRVMLEYGAAVINGAQLFVKAAGAEKGFICLEDNKQDCAEHLNELLRGKDLPLEVKVFPTRYPQGGERQLIQAACGKQVPMGGLPADCGVIVCNVQSAKAMADMAFAGEPSTSRVITVTGLVGEPQNFSAPLGTPISELVEACGGITEEHNRVIFGGPMTGPCIGAGLNAADIKVCLTKTGGGLLVLKDFDYTELNCMRCSSCAEACPAGLTPWKIDAAERSGLYDVCEKLYAAECIACGCCSYVCPAKRELTYHAAAARDKVKAIIRERGKK